MAKLACFIVYKYKTLSLPEPVHKRLESFFSAKTRVWKVPQLLFLRACLPHQLQSRPCSLYDGLNSSRHYYLIYCRCCARHQWIPDFCEVSRSAATALPIEKRERGCRCQQRAASSKQSNQQPPPTSFHGFAFVTA